MSDYKAECVSLSILAAICATVAGVVGFPLTSAVCAFWAGVFYARWSA